MCLIAFALAAAAEAQAPLQGRVVDVDGKPLADVAVCTFLDGEPFVTADIAAAPRARTGADGRFELPADGDEWDRALFVAQGRAHMVRPRTEVVGLPVVLARGRTLAGRVRDAAGAPLAGARVEARCVLPTLKFLEQMPSVRPEATALTAVRTDPNGRFVVTGTFDTAMLLRIQALGYDELEIGPVSALDPLDVRLQPAGGVLRGTVLDEDGAPVANVMVRLGQRGAARRVWLVRTDDRGAFAVSRPAGAFDLSGSILRAGIRHSFRRSFGGDAAAAEEPIVVRLQAQAAAALRAPGPYAVSPERTVRVRAATAGGTPVAAFAAAVFQVSYAGQSPRTEAESRRHFTAVAKQAADGIAPAKVHIGSGSDALLVLVHAPGFGFTRLELRGDAKEAHVTLQPEATISGKVVDGRTKAPLAGARVWWIEGLDPYPDDWRQFDVGDFAVRSADDGSFRLGGVRAGKGLLLCAVAEHKLGWARYDVASGQHSELELTCEPWAMVEGAVAGRPPLAFGIRFPKRPDGGNSGDAADYTHLSWLADDGTFRARELAPGSLWPQLVLHRLPRQGLPDKLPLGPLDFTHETKELRFDAARFAPGRLRGRITGELPLQRLLVVSAPVPTRQTYYGYLYYHGPMCPVGIDGSYEILEPPGDRLLVVIDLLTGVMLHRGEQVAVRPGGERVVDVAVVAREVQVQVVDEATPARSFLLEVEPQPEHWPGGVGQIAPRGPGSGQYSGGMGAVVTPQQPSCTLLLPPAPCKFVVRPHSPHSGARAEQQRLVECEVDPDDPKQRTLEVRVPR